MGAAGAEAAPPVGRNPKAQGLVRHRRRATKEGTATRRGQEILGGDLESKTACGPAQRIFGLGIRVKEGPRTGGAHPAGRVAENALNPTSGWLERQWARRIRWDGTLPGLNQDRFQPETPAAALNFSHLAAAAEWARIRSNPAPEFAGAMPR